MTPSQATGILAALALTGCDDAIYRNLMTPSADDLRVEIRVTPGMDGSARVAAEISLADPTACLALGTTFTGDLDGHHPDAARRGAVNDDGTCTWPQLGFAIPAADRVDTARLTIGDLTFGFAAELGDRLVPRTSALAEPGDAVVRPGARLAATWSSAADRASGGFTMALGVDGASVAALPASVAGDQVVANAPAGPVGEGAGELCVAWSSAGASADVELACDGLACRLVADYRACVPVAFAR